MSVIRQIAARILLASVYGFTWLAALLGRFIPHRRWKPTGRIMVTGTFHNPNWYLSHVIPLTRSGVQEVILIVDEPQSPLEKVRFVCPPRWLARVSSRAGAKTIWMFLAGLRDRPDLYMGYHLAPGACAALVVGRLLGRPSCYQMTGGPAGIVGGGYAAVDSIEGALGRPSKFIETLALAVVRQFDLVVVRGSKAKELLATYNIKRSVAVITGSVDHCLQEQEPDRNIHLLFVGRLAPIKQINQFIAIVHAVKQAVPNVRAAIVGDGPLRTDLQTHARELGLSDNIEFLGKRKDVGAIMAQSRVFVLTSKSEGLSIAMAEAMASGVVPVVANVGELGDLVIEGVNGYLIEPNNIDAYAEKIVSLLRDDDLWSRYSARAFEVARKHCDVEVVSGEWQHHLSEVVAAASNSLHKDVVNA